MKTKTIIVLGAVILFMSNTFSACKKSSGGNNPPPTGDTTTVNPQVDPPLAATIGFFMNDWQAKNFTIPSSTTTGNVPTASGVTVNIDRSNVITKISRSFAGNNANIWMSQLVTESPLLDHLSTIHPHIIRFPGGSISDVFFWNAQPNTPPADAPAQLVQANGSSVNAGYWFGKNTASWT